MTFWKMTKMSLIRPETVGAIAHFCTSFTLTRHNTFFTEMSWGSLCAGWQRHGFIKFWAEGWIRCRYTAIQNSQVELHFMHSKRGKKSLKGAQFRFLTHRRRTEMQRPISSLINKAKTKISIYIMCRISSKMFHHDLDGQASPQTSCIHVWLRLLNVEVFNVKFRGFDCEHRESGIWGSVSEGDWCFLQRWRSS